MVATVGPLVLAGALCCCEPNAHTPTRRYVGEIKPGLNMPLKHMNSASPYFDKIHPDVNMPSKFTSSSSPRGYHVCSQQSREQIEQLLGLAKFSGPATNPLPEDTVMADGGAATHAKQEGLPQRSTPLSPGAEDGGPKQDVQQQHEKGSGSHVCGGQRDYKAVKEEEHEKEEHQEEEEEEEEEEVVIDEEEMLRMLDQQRDKRDGRGHDGAPDGTAARAPDRVPYVQCAVCNAENCGTYKFCNFCGTQRSADREPPAVPVSPLDPLAGPVVIDRDVITARAVAVLDAFSDSVGRRRERRVTDGFDSFLRQYSDNRRGWKNALDLDVFAWLCWLDTQGQGTVVVHAKSCPGIGSADGGRCTGGGGGGGGGCTRRYSADSLEKDFLSKLKWTMSEELGKTEDWCPAKQRGNPVASPIVRFYLKHAFEEQRQGGVLGGVFVKQGPPPMLSHQLQELVRDMRRRVQQCSTASERIAVTRDIALFCVAFHTMKRGLDLARTLGAELLRLPDHKGLVFNFQFGKLLKASSQAVVVRQDKDYPEICPIRAMWEYTTAAAGVQWDMSDGHVFPAVKADGGRCRLSVTEAQMTASLQAHSRLAGLEEKRYTMQSFRVGGSGSQHLAGTAVGAVMRLVGCKHASPPADSERCRNGPTDTGSTERSSLGKRGRDRAYDDVDKLPLANAFIQSFSAFAPTGTRTSGIGT